jgi:hypothetical protein
MECNKDGLFYGFRKLISDSESMWITKIKYIYLFEWPRIYICDSKEPELNRVTSYARGVKNREDTKTGDIVNLDILNDHFLG